MPATRSALHPEFAELLALQPYTVVLDGLRLTVAEDVFPPDLGRCAQNVARVCTEYSARTALDVGCGTGFLALATKRSGVDEVWATDIHPPAVECTRMNAVQNRDVGSIQIVCGGLFEAIPPGMRFDLITFNQPYAPSNGEPICGCGEDGGYDVTKRFLVEAPAYLNEGGSIIMTFSDRVSPENDPKRVGTELGYSVVTLLHATYNESNNFIYEIRPTERRPGA